MAKRGWLNHYREGMPFAERIAKDAKAALARMASMLRHGIAAPVIVTWPDFPSKRATVSSIAAHLGAVLTNKPRSCDVVLFFDDQTVKGQLHPSIQKKAGRVLKADSLDIQKTTVEAHHLAVFGYGTFIDPTSHRGTAVCKSNGNALHDGRYVECPTTEIITDAVYQRVINNRTDDGLALDYRVAAMGDELPVAYMKFKAWDKRFTNDTVSAQRIAVDAVFSTEEQAHIIALVKRMNIDFCEVDVLRDRTEGRIYLIDVNTTPYGPPAGLPKAERRASIALLAESFQRQFIARRTSK
jgi:hypothetical protein